MIKPPPPDTKRWTPRQKAAVVQAVRLGLMTLEEARLRYDLSVEELFGWERGLDQHGHPGLRATRVQIYRNKKGRVRPKGAPDDGRW
jgi:Protein of unknown function (DUF1153)